MSLISKIEGLPKGPGVYLMKDARGKIIYVGKAKSLRPRVSSYFQAGANHSIKTQALVAKIVDFDIMLVDSEVGALILERTLIKHHRPFYNIRLQDDKEYPFVRIDLKSPWPRIRKVRKRRNDGATYLGPFGNAVHLNSMLKLANRIFPLIKCSPHEFANAKRPCNYYHMRMCLGPCVLDVNRDHYLEAVKDAISFLQGKNKDLVRELTAKMQAAALRQDYEAAAIYRDQVESYRNISAQKSVVFADIRDTDIIGFVQDNDLAAVNVLAIREGLLTTQDDFLIKIPIESPGEALQTFLSQYYENKFIPDEVCLPIPIPDAQSVELLLRSVEDSNKFLKILVPQRGTRKRLLDMADKNARYALEEAARAASRTSSDLDLIQQKFGLIHRPETIECIDISNIQGTAIVASDVCFINGRPAKDRYRLYNLADQAKAADDFASIGEVMRRRLSRAAAERDAPDLFVIDGGKGQLAAALAAAAEFPELDVAIISIAKSRVVKNVGGDDPGQTQDPSHSEERIFLPGADEGVELEVGSPEYRVFTHLRDEAHRFAISHHRKRRKKVLHGSALDLIPGIGPALRTKLFNHFGDLEGIRNASFEDLRAVPGVTERTATAILAAFAADEDTRD